ncbi:MAG TPA: glutamate formimidoyltransferase [Anaerolineales bacterium]|nr:glutamate formimidoyltransferase [Anaerolineales bacterium]
MNQPIIECIPNFSEGRRVEVVEEIESAIRSVRGVYILDRHIDPDHNRSVITFAGSPAEVADAAFEAIKTAAGRIDLNQHKGEHPRIGATDVIPFVPISEVTMDECVELARTLAQRVGDELGIPTYLYEKAATRPERKNLENIRRGEYEGLKETIGSDPTKKPDFGPPKLGSAGATVIGARAPLVAFNVYLSTDDVTIAQNIGRAVRHSSGGLRYVKALGMLVEGRAQVSMNLTNFTHTPVARVVELIRREADRYGVSIVNSELVGLIPQAALIDAAQWYLQLDQFSPDQVLEKRIYAAMDTEKRDKRVFLQNLASGSATPGGGSAAAFAGAMGAALVAMVARLTVGKKRFTEVEERMQEIIARADLLRDTLHKAVAHDAQAFDSVMAALQMPKKSEQEKAVRKEAIERATHGAAEVPLQVCRDAVEVLSLAAEVAVKGNQNALSDAGSAGAMANACLQAAALNVKINAGNVSDREAAQTWLEELDHLETQAAQAGKTLGAALD